MHDLNKQLGRAIKSFWSTRAAQGARQGARSGRRDSGNRSLVTGGKQMAGFEQLIERLLVEAGIPRGSIYCRSKKELPGYFRAEKKWDLVVVHEHALIAAIEFKSQVGSFGNNFNNRTEEALGSATDIWTAYREGVFKPSGRPWLGYLMMLEDAPRTSSPVGVLEPHFKVFEEFRGASYARRYELLIMRLLRERLYDGACFIMSSRQRGIKGSFREPNEELSFQKFVTYLTAHAMAHIELKDRQQN